MVFGPSDPIVYEANYELKYWASIEFGHFQGQWELPPNIPEPCVLEFVMRSKVDIDHSSNTVTRRSRTGFLFFLNCYLIHWLSKKQTSVERIISESESVSMN